MPKGHNLTGKTFGRLTVSEKKWIETRKRNLWMCQCECGNTTLVMAHDLLSGKTTSCGCHRKAVTSETHKTHGMSHSRLYMTWNAMKERCKCETNVQFSDYGGRGITVCDKWMNSFEEFRDWAWANGYEDHLTIDRIDVNGNYCPENCKWSTRKEQNSNKRNNRILTYNGKSQTMQAWANELGVHTSTLLYRINHNWPMEAVLTGKNQMSISSDIGQ